MNALPKGLAQTKLLNKPESLWSFGVTPLKKRMAPVLDYLVKRPYWVVIILGVGIVSTSILMMLDQQETTVLSLASQEQWVENSDFDGYFDDGLGEETHLFPIHEESTDHPDDEAVILLSMAEEAMPFEPSLSQDTTSTSAGRLDPFAPLIFTQQDGSKTLMPDQEIDADPLEAIQLVGVIQNEVEAGRSVAIIKINDVFKGNKSLVKQVGDTFQLNDDVVKIKHIEAGALKVLFGGETRTITLNEFIDTVQTKASPAQPNGDKPSGGSDDLGDLEDLEDA